MSYILDALRKADAERRGVPPPQGMTEPAVLVANDGDHDGEPTERTRTWIWVLAGVGLVLIAALSWNLWRGAPAQPPVLAQAPAPPPAVQPPVQAAPVAEPAAVVAPPESDTLPSFPPALPEAPKPEPKAAVPATPPARAAPPPGITEVLPAAAPRAVAPADRVFAPAELPDPVKRDLPRLTIGGAMYSERVSDRMVVINGQVFHEGDTVTREVKLRQIRPKSAVVEFRGHRVELVY